MTNVGGKSLGDLVRTLGRDLQERFGERVHKVALDTGFTCPNRDGRLGKGGCTFCNNETFAPGSKVKAPLEDQLALGAGIVRKRTGARKILAYFQAYTNTYGKLEAMEALWSRALAVEGVVGLSIGTRPDCVPQPVLEALARLQDAGKTIWLELGVQSMHRAALDRVNRGHGPEEWIDAASRARHLGLRVCTHLILGLPGEGREEAIASHAQVVAHGTDGLKIHPLHVVRGSLMATQWKAGGITTLDRDEYASWTADLVERTPSDVVFHRLTGTCERSLLLAPQWCSTKWDALNAIEAELRRRGTRQGALVQA
jgi:radical SAM protein (TIGR01212 family)